MTNKGNCCFAQGDYDKARYYYEEALNIDAGSVEALHNLSKTIEEFRPSIDDCSLVLTLIKSQQYRRVKDFLHKYTIIQPDNAQVFCLMGQILQETRHTEQAKSWLVI